MGEVTHTSASIVQNLHQYSLGCYIATATYFKAADHLQFNHQGTLCRNPAFQTYEANEFTPDDIPECTRRPSWQLLSRSLSLRCTLIPLHLGLQLTTMLGYML
jgi:hypothetical protein